MCSTTKPQQAACRRWAAIAGGIVAGGGLAVLGGWAFHLEWLKRLQPGLIAMKANTALAFACSGAVLLLRLRWPDAKSARAAAYVAAAMVALIGSASTLEYLFPPGIEIDRLLFDDVAEHGLQPGRMAAATAIVFLCVGPALLLLGSPAPSRRGHVAELLAICAAVLALFGFFDFAIATNVPLTAMAVHTALLAATLCAGIVLARPDARLTRLLLSPYFGGVIARRLLPLALILPVLLGFARWAAEAAGIISSEIGVVVMTAALVAALSGLICWHAAALNRLDAQRATAQSDAARLAAILEATPDYISTTELSGRIQYINAGGRRLLGLGPTADVSSLRVPDVHPGWAAKLILNEAIPASLRDGSWSGETALLARDGREIPVLQVILVHRGSGRPEYLSTIIRDISARKDAERALEQQQQRLQTAVRAFNIGLWDWELDGGISFSPEWKRQIGYADEELRSDDAEWQARLHPDDRERVLHSLREYISDPQGTYAIQFRLRHKDGSWRWIQARGAVIRENGEPSRRFIGAHLDFTAQKAAEEELKRLNRALQAISECEKAMALASGEQAFLEEVCELLVNVAGYHFCWAGSVEHDPAKTVRCLAHAGYECGYLQAVRITWDENEATGRGPTGAAVRNGEPSVARFIATDPEFAPWREQALERGYHSAIALPLQQDGVCIGNLNLYSREPDAFDALEVKLLTQLAGDVAFGLRFLHVRAERQKAEQRFHRLWEFAPDAMLGIDGQGSVRLINSQAERLFGPREPLLGAPAAPLLPAAALRGDSSGAAILAGLSAGAEHRCQSADGSWHWLNWAASAVPGENLIYAVARDITDRRLLEQQLAERAAELERSNAELEQFAYVASHDLQEPLRMVASFTSLLERRYSEQWDDRARQYSRYAVEGATRMQRLVQALLAYSRVGTRGGELVQVDSETAVREAVANLTLAIRDAGGQVHWPQGGLPRITADPIQITQLFQNLIANALKFRGALPPVITIGAAADGDLVRFEVADNGIGLDPQYRSRIFVIFQRLHSRDSYAGLGIGLAICKKIVERHGGRIWVQSEPGCGSTFYFTLRRAATAGADRTDDEHSFTIKAY